MTDALPAVPGQMSAYEAKRWSELQEHWGRKALPRQWVPEGVRSAGQAVATKASNVTGVAGRRIAQVTPERVKAAGSFVADQTFAPTIQAAVHLLQLLTDWITELENPERVLAHHRKRGRDVTELADLKNLDLAALDEVTRAMPQKWGSLGALQGAGAGALALIPVPGVGSAAAITVDMVAMQALTAAITARVCYAYGFDPSDPDLDDMIRRMTLRAYRNQAPKPIALNQAGQAWSAAKGRVRWSAKLREDHKLLAAVEQFMKRFGRGRVSVGNARMGLPAVSMVVGAGTNAHVLGDVARQARQYAATVFLAEKYGLPLPANLTKGRTEPDNTTPETEDVDPAQA